MEPSVVLWATIFGYLVGSISFARVIARIISPGKNITDTKIPVADSEDSYRAVNIGANIVANALGPQAGALVGLLDILKVVLITLLFKQGYPDHPYFLIAAITSMVGHNWPIYYQFHGGSGFSPALGGLVVIDWLAALLTPVIGLILGLFVFRSYVVASLSWLWLLIPWMWFRTQDVAYVLYAVAVNILFVLAMIPEFKIMGKYRREGRLQEYGMGNLRSTPMGRGMIRMAERLKINMK